VPEDQRQALKEIERLRLKGSHAWATYYSELADLTVSELRSLVGTKDRPPADIPVLKLVIARGMLYAMSSGKGHELQAHRDLMCGPERKQIELSGPDGESLNPASKLTPEQIAAAYQEVDRIIREAEQCKSTPNSPPSSESPVPSLPPASGTES
jgi:hypothetical protein